MIHTYTIPASFPESRDAVLQRVRRVLAMPSPPNDVPAFLEGYRFGTLLAKIIGGSDADDMKKLLPRLEPDPAENIPDGPIDGPSAPRVDALREQDMVDEPWFHIWMGIQNDRYSYERNGQAMPQPVVVAWLGYLFAHRQARAIGAGKYDELRGLLPAILDDPTPRLAPLLQLDELLVARAKRHFSPPPTLA